MSYAVANPHASSPGGGPPSTATVYDFICLFTHDLRRKQKRWQDGKLKYHSFNKKIMVYDDRGQFVGDGHWDQEGDLAPGDELSLDRGMALVQVEDCTGEKQQDLTDLLDKRAREVEKRRQIAAAKTRPTPRSSLANNTNTNANGGVQPLLQQQRPLSSLVQTPGRIGRAAIPAHSPFEARQQQQRLHQNSAPVDAHPTVAARPPPARKRQTSSPPSKAGFAKNLFGTSLSLSACPGPELMAARARALRAKMQSQMEVEAEASSTPQGEEEVEERPAAVQSSPLFVQDVEESTSSRPAKEQRFAIQPVTRHPIATARTAMREAEEAGNRNTELNMDEDEHVTQQENPSKKRRKESHISERQSSPVGTTIQDVHVVEEAEASDRAPPKRRKKNKEAPKPRNKRLSPIPLSEAIVIDEESDEIAEEAPRRQKPQKPQKEKRVKAPAKPAKPADVIEEPRAKSPEELKPKEPRTTLRIRSRKKRGLLMLREPIEPLPEPSRASPEIDIHERVIKTPSPEPVTSPSRITKSASPVEDGEEVIIPSSEPPAERHSSPTSTSHLPAMASAQAVVESSGDDDLPPPPKRRAAKQRTYGPPPGPDHDMEESQKKKPKPRRRLAKRTVDDDDDDDKPNGESQEEEESQRPTRKRRATKRTYNEEPEPQSGSQEENEAPAKVEGPRIARLPRKGIRSREILGYVPQGMESLIPGPFASATYRLGGPPVVSAVSSEIMTLAPAPAQIPAPAPVSTTTAPSPSPAPAPVPAVLVPKISIPTAPVPTVSAPTTAPTPTTTPAPIAAPAPAVSESTVRASAAVDVSVSDNVADEKPMPLFTPEPVPASLEQDVAPVPTHSSPEPVVDVPSEAIIPIVPEITARSNIVAKPPAPPLLSRNPSNASAAPTLSRNSSDTSATCAIERNEAKLETEMVPKIPMSNTPPAGAKALDSDSQTKTDILNELPAPVAISSWPMPDVAAESTSSGAETNQAVMKPRIANPATRGKKAARREDAAGPAPQVMVPFEPVQPAVRMISTRPSGVGGVGRARMSLGASVAVAGLAPLRAAPAAKKAVSMPGFTFASEGTWSRHAHDLMGIGRPQRG